jgi:hypothetical protein
VSELSAELEPVLALLAETQQQSNDLRAQGRAEAEAITHAAEDRARSSVAAARADVEAERAAAAARVSGLADSEATATLGRAERDADAVRGRAAERMPAYVDRVAAAARDVADGSVS